MGACQGLTGTGSAIYDSVVEAVGRRRAHRGGLRVVAAAVGLGLMTAGVGACGGVASDLPDAARPLAPRPTPSLAGAPSRPATPPPDCGDPTATYRPPATLPAPGGVPTGPTLREIVNRGYLTVGVRPDTPPFGSLNPDTGEFEGFDVDVANLVGRALFGDGGHVRFRAITAAQRLPLLVEGKLDMTAASLTVTCTRLKEVDFTAVYYMTAQGVLVLRDSKYRGLGDLGGRPVCAAAGTTSIQSIVDAPSKPVPYPVSNVSDCLVALQDGVVDGIVNDEMVLAGLAEQDPRTHVVGATVFDQPIAAGIGKNRRDLTAFVNGVLERAFSDGTWAGIYRRWLGRLRSPPAPPTPVYRN
jgi:polar amino acid transport system substrate-binding protein